MLFEPINNFVWFVILGRIVLLVLALWILIHIIRRIKRSEARIVRLGAQVQEELDRRNETLDKLQTKGVELPFPDQELHAFSRRQLNIPHPHLVNFVKEVREIGFNDENIKRELENCGWPQEEILQALNL